MAKAKKKTVSAKKAAKAVKKTAKPAAKKSVKPAKKAAKASAGKAVKKAVKKVAKKVAPASPKRSVAKAKAPAKAAAKPAKTPASRVSSNAAPKGARADYSDFVTPLDDRVLVRLKGADRMTAGGLFIPDTVSDVSGNFEGTVVAVGRGHRDKKGRVRPMDLNLGDRVLFGQYAGSKIRIQDEDLVLLREGEVMGVVS